MDLVSAVSFALQSLSVLVVGGVAFYKMLLSEGHNRDWSIVWLLSVIAIDVMLMRRGA